jgi:hypothetical protein
MKIPRGALAVAVIGLLLLAISLRTGGPTAAQDVAPVLRVRTLELVDARGSVRSRLNVESDGAVVLRLMDQKGTIRVKLGAGEHGSGLVLLDEATEPGVHLVARQAVTSEHGTSTSITLKGPDGRRRVIRP